MDITHPADFDFQGTLPAIVFSFYYSDREMRVPPALIYRDARQYRTPPHPTVAELIPWIFDDLKPISRMNMSS